MDEKPVTIQKREECGHIPEGVSCTETENAYYIRVRRGNAMILTRVLKDNFFNTTYSVDEYVAIDLKQWRGVFGTNG